MNIISIILSPYERAPIWKRNNYGLAFGSLIGISTYFSWKTLSTNTMLKGDDDNNNKNITSIIIGAAPVTVRNIPALIPATIMFAVSSRVIQNNIMISSCYNDVLKQVIIILTTLLLDNHILYRILILDICAEPS